MAVKESFTLTSPTIVGTHSGYVAVIKASDLPSGFLYGADSTVDGGGDLQFYTDATLTTRLPVDIKTCVTGVSSDFFAYVRVPSISTGQTIFVVIDDTQTSQPLPSALYGSEEVWQDWKYSIDFNTDTPVERAGNQTVGTVGSPVSDGESITFDGSQAVTMTNDASLDGEASFSFYADYDPTASGDQYLLWKRGSAGGYAVTHAKTSNDLRFTLFGIADYDIPETIVDRTRVYCVVDNTTVTFYANGVNAGSTTISATRDSNTSQAIIGARQDSSGVTDGYSQQQQWATKCRSGALSSDYIATEEDNFSTDGWFANSGWTGAAAPPIPTPDDTKQLNTSNPLYGNITFAWTPRPQSPKFADLLGGADSVEQPTNNAITVDEGITWKTVQGFCRNSTNWFGFDSPYSTYVDAIRKWDLSNTEVATNLSPFSSLPVDNWRLSDGCCDETTIYNPVHTYTGTYAVHLTQYNTSDLSFKSTVDITATGAGAAGCCFGESGNLYFVGFSQTPGNEFTTKITEITTAGVFVAEYTLSEEIIGMQGICWDPVNEYYYISAYTQTGNINTIYRVSKDWTILQRYDPTSFSGESEGVEYYDGKVFYHSITQSPRRVDFDNVSITRDTAKSVGLDMFSVPNTADSEGSFLLRFKPHTFYTSNAVMYQGMEQWICFIRNTGELIFRMNSGSDVSAGLLSLYTDTFIMLTWKRVGSNVTFKVAKDGVYVDTNSRAWVTPPANQILTSKTGGVTGDLTALDLLVFNKELSTAEALDVVANNDDLYVASGGVTYALDIDGGTYTSTGSSVDLLHNRLLSVDGGVYSSTGIALDLLYNRSLSVDSGSFSYAGSAVTLVYNPSTGYVMDIDGGVYSVAGGDVDTLYNRALNVDGGTYSTIGEDLALLYNRSLNIDGGIYSLTGGEINLLLDRVMQVDSGVYSYTGGAAGLIYSGQITLLIDCYSVEFKQDSVTISYLCNH